jgi:hypothetical protein
MARLDRMGGKKSSRLESALQQTADLEPALHTLAQVAVLVLHPITGLETAVHELLHVGARDGAAGNPTIRCHQTSRANCREPQVQVVVKDDSGLGLRDRQRDVGVQPGPVSARTISSSLRQVNPNSRLQLTCSASSLETQTRTAPCPRCGLQSLARQRLWSQTAAEKAPVQHSHAEDKRVHQRSVPRMPQQ